MSDKKVVLVDELGNKVTFNYDTPFFLKKITGLHKVTGSVSTTKNAWSVGEKYNGTSIPKRNIVINAEMFNNFLENRQLLYKVLPLKKTGTLYYYEKDTKVKIDYKVEDIEIEDSGIPRGIFISLICNNPYFTDIEETKVSIANWTSSFEFPISIPEDGMEFGYKNTSTLVTIANDTNIEIGMRIIFTISDEVVNPTLINVNTQEKMIIEGTYVAGDVITVTTYINNKNIILERNGVSTNINNYLKFGTKFLQIHTGSNTFKSTADSGDKNFITEIDYLVNYEAV